MVCTAIKYFTSILGKRQKRPAAQAIKTGVFQYQHTSGRSQNDLYSNTTHGKKGKRSPLARQSHENCLWGIVHAEKSRPIFLSLLLNMRKAEKCFFFRYDVWLLKNTTYGFHKKKKPLI